MVLEELVVLWAELEVMNQSTDGIRRCTKKDEAKVGVKSKRPNTATDVPSPRSPAIKLSNSFLSLFPFIVLVIVLAPAFSASDRLQPNHRFFGASVSRGSRVGPGTASVCNSLPQ